MTKFQVFDVFTKSPFGGNQLAVILDASDLAERNLQAIAREFNFSETTFVFPPIDSKNNARVRIFTPTSEIPFAGHPTIGTAIAIAQMTGETKLVLELAVGPIECQVDLGKSSSARFTTKVPLMNFGEVEVKDIASCLGLDTSAVLSTTHSPQIASVGLPFALVELASDAELSKAMPVTDKFQIAETRYANGIDMFAIFAYVKHGNDVNARMFAPLNNIPEDPATGSAAAALGAFISGIKQQSMEFSINQGVDMGRPSRINVATEFSNGACNSVSISGSAVQTMRGELTFDLNTLS
ncbi:MAG: trans-2,3-dihydro-3-hydroxyanthranilate isomerase [Paracoccaceae bacterium]|jgi:trans-2,3-dihydro-3-hydroxyanthranilate isomerase